MLFNGIMFIKEVALKAPSQYLTFKYRCAFGAAFIPVLGLRQKISRDYPAFSVPGRDSLKFQALQSIPNSQSNSLKNNRRQCSQKSANPKNCGEVVKLTNQSNTTRWHALVREHGLLSTNRSRGLDENSRKSSS